MIRKWFAMINKDLDATDTTSNSNPATPREIFAGVGLFLYLGLLMVVVDLPSEWRWNEWGNALESLLFAMLLIVPVTGYGMGWVKRFPRWSYPYVGVSFLISLYFMNASTPGISFLGYEVFGRELWGWRSWIPLGIATLVALIVSRSFQPAKKFFTNCFDDWTLFTFGMFGCMPLLVWVGFDEVNNLYTIFFTIGLNTIIVLAAYAYMRSMRMWQRVLSLGVGIVIPVAIASIGSTLYWVENGWVDIPGMIIMSIFLVFLMFIPAFIGIARYTDKSIPSE